MTRDYDPAWGERRKARPDTTTPRRRADDLLPPVQAALELLTTCLQENAREANAQQAPPDPEPLHLVGPAPPSILEPALVVPKPQPARARRRDLGHLDAWLTYATLEHWPRFQALIEAAKPRRKRMATSRPRQTRPRRSHR